MKNFALGFLLAAMLFGGYTAWADDDDGGGKGLSPAEQGRLYEEVAKKIDALAGAGGIDALVAQAENAKARWLEKAPQLYARVALRVSQTLSSRYFEDRAKKRRLSHFIALDALSRTQSRLSADALGIRTRCVLATHICQRIARTGKALVGIAARDARRQQLALWVGAWKAIEEATDPDWDPEAVPPPNPPGAEMPLPSNATSEARRRYEELVQRHRAQVERYLLQKAVRRIRREILPHVHRRIVGAYKEPGASIDELRVALADMDDREAVRAVLDAAETK